MTELQRFRPRWVRRHYQPLRFERASLALVAQAQRALQPQRIPPFAVEVHSEWRDPPHAWTVASR